MTPNESNKSSESPLARWLERSAPGPLAIGGVLAGMSGFEAAEGALVVIDPNLEITAGFRVPAVEGLDFDGDGLNEVAFVVGTASVIDGAGNNGWVNAGGLYGAEVAFSGAYPMALQASQMVGSSLNFETRIGTLALSSGGRLGTRGNWFGGHDAYFGVRFTLDGAFCYGWVHAMWSPVTNTLTIDEAAYDDSGAAVMIPGDGPEYPENFNVTIFKPEDGRVEVRWPVLGGRTYELQRSSALQDWTPIHTITPLSDGVSSFLDEEFAGNQKEQCFYRVQQLGGSLMMLALGMRRPRREEES